jgi:hypothetical protein
VLESIVTINATEMLTGFEPTRFPTAVHVQRPKHSALNHY